MRAATARSATITLRGADFARTMQEMRAWLDQHFFEPNRFTYEQNREIIVISVEFEQAHQAEAFQSRFDGQQREIIPSLSSARKQVNRAAEPRATFDGAETPATMAQACWWRLVAEEIRTEADTFASEAAKETMEMAARSWEQLAEELEHRLALNGDQRQGFFFR
jgi:hypothetical protein